MNEEEKELKKVSAKREPSIEAGVELHKVPAWKILKSVIYKVKGGLLGVCIRGDLKINTKRLEKYLREPIRTATKDELIEAGLAIGFISPIGLKIPFIADHSVKYVKNFCTGANEMDYDVLNANVGRDFTIKEFLHLTDMALFCHKCKHQLIEVKAIEAGNIFKLGTKYSKDFNLKFMDQDGVQQTVIMGCYGIGNTRLLGTIVEASHDEKGIIWPKTVAPFDVHLVGLGNDESVNAHALQIYNNLRAQGVEVLYDDRNESAGKKLNDADLIGIPLRVLVSKKTLEKNGVEVKWRSEKEAKIVPESEPSALLNIK